VGGRASMSGDSVLSDIWFNAVLVFEMGVSKTRFERMG
jgi:hypothetical protein